MSASVDLPGTASSGEDPVLAELVEEITNRLQAGEHVDLEAYAAAHPEQAGPLRQLLPALQVLAALSGQGENDAPPAAETEALHGRLGDFRIIREVGRGGMGVVYEAEQVSLRRRVALKVLPLAGILDERRLRRFQNEAQAAAGLHHTHIVPVYSVGCERGTHFYAMQFIDGRSLSEILLQLRKGEQGTAGGRAPQGEAAAAEEHTTAYQPPPAGAAPASPTAPPARDSTPLTGEGRRGRAYFRTVAELGIQAAEALDHAHQVGVVHRDVKPANLLVDGRGHLWVTDFGLAQVQQGEAGLTMTGDVIGTLRYMSPEQALAKRVVLDHRTDVYSLGATLYELLTLRPAFAGTDRQELLRQIAFDDPPPPRRLDRAVPVELETVVLKALEKAPQDRYATAQELADDLRRWLDDRPIRARRPSTLQRLRKWARRHRAAVNAAAASLLIVVAVVAGTIGWGVRDREARRSEAVRRAGEALGKAGACIQEENWPEGVRAVEQAEGFLAGFEAEAAPRLQVRQLRRELVMAFRLQEAQLRMAALKEGHFDLEAGDTAYEAAFRDYGVDVDGLDPQAVAEQVRARPLRRQLVTALDSWSWLQKQRKREGWKQRLAVARSADPDPWRDRLREALETTEPVPGRPATYTDGRNRLPDVQEAKELRALEEAAAADPAQDWPAETLVLLAQLACRTGSAQRVAALLSRAQHRHPGDFWINETLGALLEQSRPPRVEEAIHFYGAAVALRPQSPCARLNLGGALADQGRQDEAIAEFREAIRLQSDYSDAHNGLGAALAQKGQPDRAIAELREAIRLRPDFALAHFNLGNAFGGKGKLDEAAAEYREAMRLKPDDPMAYNNLGDLLRGRGQLDEAIGEYRKALGVRRDAAVVHFNLALALQQKGQPDEAITEYREALRLQPDYPEARSNLGNALLCKGRLDDAIDEYRAAIRVKSDDARFHYNLGIALTARGRPDEAITEFQEATHLNKDYAKAHNMLGAALRDKGRSDEAIAEYREVIRINPDDPEAHYGLGRALFAKGRLDETISAYREAVRLKPDYPMAQNNLGLALQRENRLDEAIAAYRAALATRQDFPDAYMAHFNLGNALADKGQLDEAIAGFRQALRLKADSPEVHCNLGRALVDKGEFREGVEELLRGHELGSRNPRWGQLSAQWLRDAERLAELDARLPALLKGQEQPKDAGERLALAQFCQMRKKLFAAAVRWYGEAFAAQSPVADNLASGNRYNAACAAARAGCGQGQDAADLDEKERARLRKQALDWLRADLEAWRRLLDKGPVQNRPAIGQQLAHWLEDTDFVGVRGPDALARLPEAERGDWQRLWTDAADTLARAQEKIGPENKPESK